MVRDNTETQPYDLEAAFKYGAFTGWLGAVVVSIMTGLVLAANDLAIQPGPGQFVRAQSEGPLTLLIVFFVGGLTVGGVLGAILGAICGPLFALTNSIRKAPVVMGLIGAAAIPLMVMDSDHQFRFLALFGTVLLAAVFALAGAVFARAVELLSFRRGLRSALSDLRPSEAASRD